MGDLPEPTPEKERRPVMTLQRRSRRQHWLCRRHIRQSRGSTAAAAADRWRQRPSSRGHGRPATVTVHLPGPETIGRIELLPQRQMEM